MRFGRVVFFAAALTSVLCTGAAWAQTGTVSGTVTDSTGAPVSGADVRVDGTTIHVLTDDRGHFELTGVPGRCCSGTRLPCGPSLSKPALR